MKDNLLNIKKLLFFVLLFPLYGSGATAYDLEGIKFNHTAGRGIKSDMTADTIKVIDDKLPLADPFVMYHQGKYYAYGTRVNGFEVYVSNDLKYWRVHKQLALSPNDTWGDRWFWAPEVYYVESKDKFYMFYSVDEHICVATSAIPYGPFIQQEKKPIIKEKAIDTHLFIDDDGTPYLYFVRFTDGNVIWVAQMNEDLQSIKPQTLTKCISAEQSWEKIQGKVAEGPSVFKRGERYYMMYSANHFESKDYGVGYATAISPNGPWVKYNGNPILRRDKPAASEMVGTGHGAPFIDADGKYKYIYHVHASEDRVGPRKSNINDMEITKEGLIRISGQTIRPVVIE